MSTTDSNSIQFDEQEIAGDLALRERIMALCAVKLNDYRRRLNAVLAGEASYPIGNTFARTEIATILNGQWKNSRQISIPRETVRQHVIRAAAQQGIVVTNDDIDQSFDAIRGYVLGLETRGGTGIRGNRANY